MQCCESSSEERSAGNPHATICGNRRWATASGDPVAGAKFPRATHLYLKIGDDDAAFGLLFALEALDHETPKLLALACETLQRNDAPRHA